VRKYGYLLAPYEIRCEFDQSFSPRASSNDAGWDQHVFEVRREDVEKLRTEVIPAKAESGATTGVIGPSETCTSAKAFVHAHSARARELCGQGAREKEIAAKLADMFHEETRAEKRPNPQTMARYMRDQRRN
jgi:hypothetical protein